MSDEVIKDASGRTIGYVRTMPNGRQQAFDAERQYQGYYDARNKVTKDRGGALIAKGNIVEALILKRWRG